MNFSFSILLMIQRLAARVCCDWRGELFILFHFLEKQSCFVLTRICDKIPQRNEEEQEDFAEKWGVARNLGHCHGWWKLTHSPASSTPGIPILIADTDKETQKRSRPKLKWELPQKLWWWKITPANISILLDVLSSCLNFTQDCENWESLLSIGHFDGAEYWLFW